LSILNIVDAKKEYISGVTIPWVYMGMMFATFCWHVEDLWLNSLSYNHKGGTKTWYIIPRQYKERFDEFVATRTGRTDLLERITYMLDPL
jgi:histone demethylase JARID1